MPSIPEGSEGNIPLGLFQTLCLSSQKQRGHSPIKESDDGESLNAMI
jgi:hypothetical protein